MSVPATALRVPSASRSRQRRPWVATPDSARPRRLALTWLCCAGLALGCSESPTGGNGANANGGGQQDVALFSDAQPSADSGGDTAGTLDTGAPDTGAPDTGPKDAGFSVPDGAGDGEFGKPCKGDQDCKSGHCIEGYSGFVCTQGCGDGAACPTAWTCNKVFLGGTKSAQLCVPDVSKLCQSCATDLDCLGGLCVKSGDESYCASLCPKDGCPGSHSCTALPAPDGGEPVQACTPKSGSCSCSSATVGLIRACKVSAGPKTCYGIETCQSGGWAGCGLPKEVCDGEDNNCDGQVDEGFVDGAGQYTTTAACGSCGNGCGALSFANATPVCQVSAKGALCGMQCKATYFDVNQNPNDGCECQKKGNTDHPDGTDRNCDGVDGQVDAAVFVAKNGDDKAAGTLSKPVRSVAKGIALAASTGKRDVYVATGVYEGSLTLAAGVHVYGGYSSDFAWRDPVAYQTVVLGTTPKGAQPGAVNALGLAGAKATFAGFTVFGANVKSKGSSTYGVYIRDCDAGLIVRNNRVVAGNAGNGTPGKAGANGASGKDGAAGAKAKDIGKTTCTSSVYANGGSGGSHSCGGSSVSGGAGGRSICPDYDEDGAQPKSSPYKQSTQSTELGKAGKGAGAGSGGVSGYDSIIWEGGASCGLCSPPRKVAGGTFLETTGGHGKAGKSGASGGVGAACSNATGTVVAGLWKPASASSGKSGAHGGGGGGGGAGGGVEVSSKCTKNTLFKYPDLGGSGGGGGSGGCGGAGGTAGTGGGGSFGVFLSWTGAASGVPSLYDNEIATGNGGDGGAGGQGGVGGIGGDGAFGGADDGGGKAWCASAGGNGGRGGDGGHGAGGGGGCGGVSFGLFVANPTGTAHKALKSKNKVTVVGAAGQGGAGGKSLGGSGANGASGASGSANF